MESFSHVLSEFTKSALSRVSLVYVGRTSKCHSCRRDPSAIDIMVCMCGPRVLDSHGKRGHCEGRKRLSR